jgi:hypothetical protein
MHRLDLAEAKQLTHLPNHSEVFCQCREKVVTRGSDGELVYTRLPSECCEAHQRELKMLWSMEDEPEGIEAPAPASKKPRLVGGVVAAGCVNGPATAQAAKPVTRPPRPTTVATLAVVGAKVAEGDAKGAADAKVLDLAPKIVAPIGAASTKANVVVLDAKGAADAEVAAEADDSTQATGDAQMMSIDPKRGHYCHVVCTICALEWRPLISGNGKYKMNLAVQHKCGDKPSKPYSLNTHSQIEIQWVHPEIGQKDCAACPICYPSNVT